MPEPLLLPLMAVVLLAAWVQGSTGMGFALILAPVLALLAPELLPVCVLALMVPLNAYIAWRDRRALSWHSVAWISVGRLAGTGGGLALLWLLSVPALSVLVGASTLAAALLTLAMPAFAPGVVTLLLAGLTTGITETATSIGGPPLALALQHRPVAEMRATMALCFLLGELLTLGLLQWGGLIHASHWLATAWLLPALALGMGLSHHVHHRIPQRVMRHFVLAFAVASGALLVWRGLW